MSKILKVTEELLKDPLLNKGTFLVVELLHDHNQLELQTVPKGTRGIITGTKLGDGGHVFVFPHSVLKEKVKAFSDGDVRVIQKQDFIPLGRIG